MIIPENEKTRIDLAQNIVEQCQRSLGSRGSAYTQYNQWIETGRGTTGLSSCNLLHAHIDRLTSHLFSPINLRFNIDYLYKYGDRQLDMAEMAERPLNFQWNMNALDLTFGQAVKIGLKLGGCLFKQNVQTVYSEESGKQVFKRMNGRIVFPWNFGVTNETENSLEAQEGMCETVYLNKHQIWRRIYNLPDADKLYKRILGTASKNEGMGAPGNFFNQVLSTAVLAPSPGSQTRAGGVVQLTTSDNLLPGVPEVGEDVYPMHEMYVWDDDRADFITIQMIEPDVIISPRLFAPSNAFCPGTLPYELVQPNIEPGYFWGRSEIVDLMMLQQLLSTTYDDVKRVIGQQFDKFLMIEGDGITQEIYDQMHSNGWANTGAQGKVNDLTPQLPNGVFDFIGILKQTMGEVSGFPPIMSGMGETGVRSGLQTDTLMKTGSPRLRDRSLVVERQCSSAGNKTLMAMQAKDARAYWTSAEDPDRMTDFLLSQLPEDRRVTVDSHSSSPIYQEDQENRIAFLFKGGLIDGRTAIEMMDVPNADLMIERYEKAQEAKAAQLKELQQRDPAAAAKLMGKKAA